MPGLVSSAIVPRWWGVTRNELHAVALYQRAGEEILTAAAKDEKLRETVMNILADRMLSERVVRVNEALRAGTREGTDPADDSGGNILSGDGIPPTSFPENAAPWERRERNWMRWLSSYPAEVSLERLSHDFGVPHPALEQSYSRELLNVKPFPAFMGFPSRLLAETWDSDNLYWARIADEMRHGSGNAEHIWCRN